MPALGEDPSDTSSADINPYKVLCIDATSSPETIKTAYRKAALKWHPDKAATTPEAKERAHQKFTRLALAYAILSDPARRKGYDVTGRTDSALDADDDFDWISFYRAQYAEVVTSSAIAEFTQTYKGSDEERDALLAAYKRAKGNMTSVYDSVMTSDPALDDARFRAIINDAIADGTVPAYDKFTKETHKSIQRRIKKAEREAREAGAHARELGLDNKTSKTKKKSEPEDMTDLVKALQANQQGRASGFLDYLEDKYEAGSKKGKRKRKVDGDGPVDEPSEEAFAANRKKAKDKKS